MLAGLIILNEYEKENENENGMEKSETELLYMIYRLVECTIQNSRTWFQFLFLIVNLWKLASFLFVNNQITRELKILNSKPINNRPVLCIFSKDE